MGKLTWPCTLREASSPHCTRDRLGGVKEACVCTCDSVGTEVAECTHVVCGYVC